jgi:hypothetical protein
MSEWVSSEREQTTHRALQTATLSNFVFSSLHGEPLLKEKDRDGRITYIAWEMSRCNENHCAFVKLIDFYTYREEKRALKRDLSGHLRKIWICLAQLICGPTLSITSKEMFTKIKQNLEISSHNCWILRQFSRRLTYYIDFKLSLDLQDVPLIKLKSHTHMYAKKK